MIQLSDGRFISAQKVFFRINRLMEKLKSHEREQFPILVCFGFGAKDNGGNHHTNEFESNHSVCFSVELTWVQLTWQDTRFNFLRRTMLECISSEPSVQVRRGKKGTLCLTLMISVRAKLECATIRRENIFTLDYHSYSDDQLTHDLHEICMLFSVHGSHQNQQVFEATYCTFSKITFIEGDARLELIHDAPHIIYTSDAFANSVVKTSIPKIDCLVKCHKSLRCNNLNLIIKNRKKDQKNLNVQRSSGVKTKGIKLNLRSERMACVSHMHILC